MKKLLAMLVVLLMPPALFVGYGTYRFHYPKYHFFTGPNKTWAHRGYVKNAPENSPASVRAAFARGASGVEIDVFYDEQHAAFVVSHDKPYIPVNGKIVVLEEILRLVPDQRYLWLDFKNLNAQTVDAAKVRLHHVLDRHHLKERTIIESKSSREVGKLAWSGLHVSYWRAFTGKETWLDLLKQKMMVAYAGVTTFSMDYRRYDTTTRNVIRGYPTMLFTINHPELISKYSDLEQIKVILTDADHY